MRCLILFTALYSLSFTNLRAQETNKNPNLIIGVQVGGAVSSVRPRTSDFTFKQRSVLRPVFGLYADIGSTHLISLRTGISYLMFGNRAQYVTGNWTTRLSYFAVPLLAKYKAHGGEFAIFAGPQIGFLNSADLKAPHKEWEDITDECEKTEIAGIIGVSVEPKNSPVNFSLAWHMGFKKVYTEHDGADLHNRGFTLALQYKLFKK